MNSEYQNLITSVLDDKVTEARKQKSVYAADSKAAPFVTTVSFGPDDIATLILIHSSVNTAVSLNVAHLDDLRHIAHRLLGDCLDKHRLSNQLNFYRMLADASTDTIVRGNLDGVRLYVSPSIRELLGYTPEELVGSRAADITHPDDREGFAAMMKEVRKGQIGTGTHEMRQRHKDGHWVWMEACLRLTHDRFTGMPDGYVVSVRGIEKRKALEARLERMAGYDELTGLPNRALFRQQLQEQIAQRSQFTLLYMDLDGFKQVNDRLGHGAGDAVLKDVAQRLLSALNDGDVVARVGGDEFIGIINSSAKDIIPLCERLIASIALPFFVGGAVAKVGLSIGIGGSNGAEKEVDTLLSRADAALYEAKAAGKSTYRFA